MQNLFTRRKLLTGIVKTGLCWPVAGAALCQRGCGGGSSLAPPPPPGDGYSGTDDQLFEEIEKAGFLFFWEQANPATGQVKDRALAAGNDTSTVSSIAATGFGLTVLCIGAQRGYQAAVDITGRVRATLTFLLNQMQPQGQNGFFYHFADMTTGTRAFTSEVSSIDMAILLCGDVGIPMLIAENYRTGFVWDTFMKNPEALAAMQLAGFQLA